MNAFDVIGPVMVGPSSSHTAGAARAGLVASALLGSPPRQGIITLHGSFARTGWGHGTPQAVVGGLLGFRPDDIRLKESFRIAKEQGFQFELREADLGEVHPNTVKIELTGADGCQIRLVASSVGGGMIEVVELDGMPVSFDARYDTTILFGQDKMGAAAAVTAVFAANDINIAQMKLYRRAKDQETVIVLESDGAVPDPALRALRASTHITRVAAVRPF